MSTILPAGDAKTGAVNARASGMKSLSILLSLALVACMPVAQSPQGSGATADPVRLTADRTAAREVRLVLYNDSTAPLGYNLCTSGLQRRDGSRWIPVETGEVCTMELRTLNPGGSAAYDKSPPATLAAGEYRYATGVESPLGTAQVPVASNSFRLD